MNLVNPYIFAPPVDLSTNTEIGGVASTISTPALLAAKLGISVGAISNFTVVGSDIKCKITGSYAIPNSAFAFNATPCTYYRDSDCLVTSIGNSSFYYTTNGGVNFGNIDFKNVTTIAYAGLSSTKALYISLLNCMSVGDRAFWHFSGVINKESIYIPNCTTLGTTVGDNEVFTGISSGSIIYAHPSLATNNAGAPDGDLAYAISQGAIVRYVTNFTIPNAITDLSAEATYNTAIRLGFTVPISVNGIDYYEVYKNGVFVKNIKSSGEVISQLLPSTSYSFTVIGVDMFLNKSIISNTLNITTTNVAWDMTTGLVSYYKLNEASGNTAFDSYGVYNLLNTSITVNQTGKLGKSYLSATSANNLNGSFANITGNFTINIWLYRTAAGAGTYNNIIETGSFGAGTGFGLWINSGQDITWRINSNYNNYATANTSLPLNTWAMITFVYDGSFIYMYKDSILKRTEACTTNPASSTVLTLFDRSGGFTYFGKIDEPSIYNTALNQSKINILYNSGIGITL